jgi:sec-independent protein translocase protein TatA
MNVMFASFIGGWEMILILLVVLVLFGAKKLPELAKGLGQGIKEFKKATRDVQDELQSAMEDNPPRRYPVSNPEPPRSIPNTTSSPADSVPVNSTPATSDTKVKTI